MYIRFSIFTLIISAVLALPSSAEEPADDGAVGNFMNSLFGATNDAASNIGEYTKKTKFRVKHQNANFLKNPTLASSTKAARHKLKIAWTKAGNDVKRCFSRVLGKTALKAIPPVTSVADMSTGAGAISGGDYAGGTASILNESAKGLVSSAGAAAGTAAGAAAGTWLAVKTFGMGGLAIGGPVGGVIGGAVGGIIAAVGTGMLYDAYAGDKVTKTIEDALKDREVDPFEQALFTKQDLRVEQLLRERELQMMARFRYENRDEQEVQLIDPPISVETPESPIPNQSTISVLIWTTDNPIDKRAGVLRVRNGTVSGTLKDPPPIGATQWKQRTWFEGTIKGNVISGVWRHELSYEMSGLRGSDSSKTIATCVLQPGGTLEQNGMKTATVVTIYPKVEGGQEGTIDTYTSPPHKVQMGGTWKLSGRVAKLVFRAFGFT